LEKVIVIGSGFAGLSAACFLAKAGAEVTVIEKNSQPGGRARSFSANGFTFDMGPSWYWMPDVFERFFNQFSKTVEDYYHLQRLDPSYQVIWEDETVAIPANYNKLRALFETKEPGAADKLDAFMQQAAYKYAVAMNKFVHKPGLSALEFANWDVIKSAMRIDLLSSIHKHVRSYFTNPKLLQLTEFPILFLGTLPKNTPALYSLMNYADMKLGTWYPDGGMVKIVDGMYDLACSLGVNFSFGNPATSIDVYNYEATAVTTAYNKYTADSVIVACDYHHGEQLLPNEYRNYDDKYWNTRSMAPSSIIFYLGINKKLDNLTHHNLFFNAPFDQHAAELYTTPQWPTDPLMYVCCPSKTDDSVAPDGCENLFVLIPVAPGLADTQDIRERYYDIVIDKLEKRTGQTLRDAVLYKRSYAHNDFTNDYNAFKGNAYGLANTLMQTAFLKPSIKNKTLPNVFYTGQLTVPGPGVPPSLISGEIVAAQVSEFLIKKSFAL
jgi:phytoene desaturase